MSKTRPIRAPAEFVAWVDNLSNDFSMQTGLPKNNTATMRRMAMKLNGRLIVKGTDFDIAIFGKVRRK